MRNDMWQMQKKGNFEVRMRCVVNRVVQCHGCTEEEAENDPWKYAVDERDDGLIDWEVLSVESDN